MVGVEPVDYGLVVDAEDVADAAEVGAFEVEADCFALGLVGATERLWVRGMDAVALFAPVATAAGTDVAGFSLLR